MPNLGRPVQGMQVVAYLLLFSRVSTIVSPLYGFFYTAPSDCALIIALLPFLSLYFLSCSAATLTRTFGDWQRFGFENMPVGWCKEPSCLLLLW